MRSFSKCLSRKSATEIDRRRAERNSERSSTPQDASARVRSLSLIGGAYMRPPADQSRLMPRAILSVVAMFWMRVPYFTPR